MLDCKTIDTPMDLNVKLLPDRGSFYEIQGDISGL